MISPYVPAAPLPNPAHPAHALAGAASSELSRASLLYIITGAWIRMFTRQIPEQSH